MFKNMKFILGIKENMSEYFLENGKVVPVTIVSATPSTVTRVFSKDKDGYDSVQVGFGSGKKEKMSKAVIGSMKGGANKNLK